ncbi:hypothetical protein KUL72_30155 [Bradyrhizobium arachidis]|uniref:hypothetical protein n=1 Tax=Bradyrhizobium arachidis TaxID=858423 RepID=UPI002163D1BC|nr:hypothetical protein [Bradyrhizobium arachidis]UVO35648.1 hypothetical protein KUL72_30155 [Bradyrhizobium arachidis]
MGAAALSMVLVIGAELNSRADTDASFRDFGLPCRKWDMSAIGASLRWYSSHHQRVPEHAPSRFVEDPINDAASSR